MGPLSALWGRLRELKQRHWRFHRTLPDGSRLTFRDVDRCIIDEVYAQKAYGPVESIPPGGVVVDAGGHIGVFALWAAGRVGRSGRVLVFEPAPENLVLLRRNVDDNGLSQVAVFDCALSDREGRAELYLAPGRGNPAANTLIASPDRKAVEVSLRTLDSIASEEKLSRIDLLKIDVEGAELRLLQGAPEALKTVRRVVMEIHPEKLDPGEVLEFLKAAGFRIDFLSQEAHSWLVDARR